MLKTKQVILMTVLFILLLPVFALAGTVELPKTGQTTCYNSSGTVITCTGTGQDGDIQSGVAWPNPRFTNNGDGTVTDILTGLMWTQDGNVPGPVACSPATTKTWQGALDYVACLNSNRYLGYTDWRLPNVIEFESLPNAGQSDSGTWLNTQGFSNVPSSRGRYYWSSTSNNANTGSAFIVDVWTNDMREDIKSFLYYVWPVRSGQLGVAQLWKTGQTTCYNSARTLIACAGTGQDGDMQAGVAWPSPRFTVSGDCVTDNLTGLMWTKDANLSRSSNTWSQAISYGNNLTLCGYTDWRLPNLKELHTLTDFAQYNPALTSGHPFLNVQSNPGRYWSSNSFAPTNPPAYAWFVEMFNGRIMASPKSHSNYVWPVRGGLYHSIVGTVTENATPLGNVTMTSEGTASTTTTTAGDGTYSFTNLPDESYTVTPSMSNYNFTPPSRSVTVAGADATAQDFSAVCIQHTYYRDVDGDTYGNASDTIQSCTQPFGFVTNSTDCNDSNVSVNPGAAEVCNGIDDNCNGQIDEGCMPDLTVSAMITPYTALPGQTILISDTTTNQGTAVAGASSTKYYRATHTANPILIGSRSVPSLAPGETSSGTTSVTLPSFLCSGMNTTLYIKAVADADVEIAESSETNNTRFRSIKMGPDLIMPSLTAQWNTGVGKTISISDTTKNQGGCTADASTTKFFLSADNVLDSGDTLLGSRSVPSLTSGAVSSGSTSVTIPAGIATGKYYIIAVSDADNAVAEIYEGNNKKVRVINILPDLIVSVLSAPATAGAGASVSISETTKNIGGSTAAASTTKFYLSADMTYDSGDTLLGSRSIPSLASGVTDPGSTSVTIPLGTASGAYYIIGKADADEVVAETNENNNKKYRLITVP